MGCSKFKTTLSMLRQTFAVAYNINAVVALLWFSSVVVVAHMAIVQCAFIVVALETTETLLVNHNHLTSLDPRYFIDKYDTTTNGSKSSDTIAVRNRPNLQSTAPKNATTEGNEHSSATNIRVATVSESLLPTTTRHQQILQRQCGIYLAMSTIAGAGLGAFTGTNRTATEAISKGDVMIPVFDVLYHIQALDNETLKRPDWEYLDPTRDYVWYGKDIGMQYETAHHQNHVSGIAYGLDTAINCHLALYNARKDHVSYDFMNLHRSKDPGIGAFTPYHNSSTIVQRDLIAGSELFKSYGDSWFIERAETFGMVPLTKDYSRAETIARKLHGIFTSCNVSQSTRSDMYYDLIVSSPFYNTSRTLQALPKAYSHVEYIAEHGIKAYHQQNASHSLEYLQQHGRCMDNIEPQPSTIRQAGRGAFATQFIARNSIAIGTPFLFFPSDDFFKLYDGNWITKNREEFNPNKHVGYQLMYNYCWKHELNISSIVLCPYGMNVNYINHNQTLANVRLQWAEHGVMNHNSTLLLSNPTAMYYSDAPQLWMDLIATRDIQPGEEIFMNYGTVWEQAWYDHVQKWNQNKTYPTDYISAYDWNRINPRAILRTEVELMREPYPAHFAMVCLPDIANSQYIDLLTSEVCKEAWNPSVIGLPCKVISRERQDDGSYWYHVTYQNLQSKEWIDLSDYWIVREAIRFINTPYTNDIFLQDAFRQAIGIPDAIFPEAWRGMHIPPLPPLKRTKQHHQ